MRWVAQLAQFNFKITYRSGKSNTNADVLSRLGMTESHTADIFQQLTKSSSLLEEKGMMNEQIHLLEMNSMSISSSVTFPEYSKAELNAKQMNDEVLSRVWHWRNSSQTKPTEKQIGKEPISVRKLLRKWDKLQEVDGVLYYISKDQEIDNNLLFLTPECLGKLLAVLYMWDG